MVGARAAEAVTSTHVSHAMDFARAGRHLPNTKLTAGVRAGGEKNPVIVQPCDLPDNEPSVRSNGLCFASGDRDRCNTHRVVHDAPDRTGDPFSVRRPRRTAEGAPVEAVVASARSKYPLSGTVIICDQRSGGYFSMRDVTFERQ